MSLDTAITIPEAALKHGVSVKRLRGVVWRENSVGGLDLPIGCFVEDKIYDDWRLERWASQFNG